jgi:hypothetical protein
MTKISITVTLLQTLQRRKKENKSVKRYKQTEPAIPNYTPQGSSYKMQSSLLHMSYLVFKITDILNVVKPF